MQKVVAFGHLLHLRSGVGDRDEVAADFIGADRLLRALEEILFEDVGFERAARFAGDDEQRLRNIDLMFEAFDLCRDQSSRAHAG